MSTALTRVTVLVGDQDAALEFYRDVLGLVVRADEEVPEGRRVTVSPGTAESLQRTFVEADTPKGPERVGSRAADHVPRVLGGRLRGELRTPPEVGVEFRGEPTHDPWGTGTLFEGPY